MAILGSRGQGADDSQFEHGDAGVEGDEEGDEDRGEDRSNLRNPFGTGDGSLKIDEDEGGSLVEFD